MSLLKKIFSNPTLLSIISGVLMGLAYPPVNMYVFIFIGFVLYIYLLDTSDTYKKAVYRSYITIFTMMLVMVSWIMLSGFRESADRFMIIGGFLTMLLHPIVFYLLPAMAFVFISRYLRVKRFPYLYLFLLPFIWVAFEYVQTWGQLTFPWLSFGYTMTYNLNKIQYIDITGMLGISFWICMVCVYIYYTIVKIRDGEWNTTKQKLTALAVIVLLYFLPDIYGLVTNAGRHAKNDSEEKINVGIIQPNINPWKKWGAKQLDLTLDYASQIRMLAAQNPKPEMIIMPETAFPYYLRYAMYGDKYLIVQNVIDSTGVPLLTGTPDLYVYSAKDEPPPDAKVFESDGKKYDTFNTALLIEKGKDKEKLQKHNKMKLVIGSERMPYQEKLSFLRDIVRWTVGLSSFQLGSEIGLFDLNGKYKFNTAICYESVYPEFFAEGVDMGADFSVIITNDGWWGKLFGTYQHNQYAVLRAVENRRWIARSANTGISGSIDPFGNLYDQTPINEKAAFISEIGVRKEKTFYTMNGDIFAKVVCVIAGVLLVMAFVMKKRA